MPHYVKLVHVRVLKEAPDIRDCVFNDNILSGKQVVGVCPHLSQDPCTHILQVTQPLVVAVRVEVSKNRNRKIGQTVRLVVQYRL